MSEGEWTSVGLLECVFAGNKKQWDVTIGVFVQCTVAFELPTTNHVTVAPACSLYSGDIVTANTHNISQRDS